MVGRAQWRKVKLGDKPVIVRVMEKEREPELKLAVRRTRDGFVVEGEGFVLRSLPGQDIEEFFREVGGYIVGFFA